MSRCSSWNPASARQAVHLGPSLCLPLCSPIRPREQVKGTDSPAPPLDTYIQQPIVGPRNLHFNKEPTACVYLPVRAEVRRMERSKGSIITRISAQEGSLRGQQGPVGTGHRD